MAENTYHRNGTDLAYERIKRLFLVKLKNKLCKNIKIPIIYCSSVYIEFYMLGICIVDMHIMYISKIHIHIY